MSWSYGIVRQYRTTTTYYSHTNMSAVKFKGIVDHYRRTLARSTVWAIFTYLTGTVHNNIDTNLFEFKSDGNGLFWWCARSHHFLFSSLLPHLMQTAKHTRYYGGPNWWFDQPACCFRSCWCYTTFETATVPWCRNGHWIRKDSLWDDGLDEIGQ